MELNRSAEETYLSMIIIELLFIIPESIAVMQLYENRK